MTFRATLTDLASDLRHAARLLTRERGYTAVALLGIALGIGAATTLFSVTYGVLLKPLPWPEPDRVVRLEERRGGRSGRIPLTITNGTYLAWTEAATVEHVGGWMSVTSTFSDGHEPERIRLGRLTPTIFTVLQARPLMGRPFEPRDAATSQGDVVILSHGFWQRRFGGATDILGRSIRLDERPYTVIGVMPSAFAFPDRETQAWTPAFIAPVYSEGGDRISLQIFGAIARMRPGVTAAQVSAEGTAQARAARDPGSAALALFGSAEPPTITATPAHEVAVADVRPAIRVMLAGGLLLFATSIAGVVIVQLARLARRRREMALRAALGAGTARLARQWLTESVVVGVAGGVLGIGGAQLLIGSLPAILPADFPRLTDITLDWRVGLAATGATVAAIVACALFPAMQARRLDITRSLADDGSAPVGAGMRTPAARMRSAIMAGQVAVACVLLIGAGLLGRSLQALVSVDRGYDPANLVTARLPLPSGPTFATSAAMFEAVKERMRALPGVTHAAFGNALPLVSAGGMTGLNVRLPRDPATVAKIQALHRTVDPDYFAAMGLRLRAGRLLADSDTATSQPVLVVNKSFADQYLGEEPIGKRLALSLYRKAEWEIVGVVEDMKQGGLQTGAFVATTDAPQPEMFSSYRQFGEMRVDNVFFLARATSEPSHLVPSIRTRRPRAGASPGSRFGDDDGGAGDGEPVASACLRARGGRDGGVRAGDRLCRPVRSAVLQRGAADPRDWRAHGARRENGGRRRARAAIGAGHRRHRSRRRARRRRIARPVAVENPVRCPAVRSDHVRRGTAVPGAGSGDRLHRASPPRGRHRSASGAAHRLKPDPALSVCCSGCTLPDMADWKRGSTFKFLFVLLGAVAVAFVAAGCRSNQAGAPAAAVSADTWAVVDGRPITKDDVDKAYRRTRDVSQTLSEEEILTAKLALLNDLIVQEILLARAASLKVELPQSELDTAYDNAKKNLSDEAYQQELTTPQPDAGGHEGRAPPRDARAEGDRAGGRLEDRGRRQRDQRFLHRQSRAVQRRRGVVSHRADRDHTGARPADQQRHRRRCHDAAGGGGESARC